MPCILSEKETAELRELFSLSLSDAEYDINFADMDTELLMIATIKSAQGITDMLKQIFEESIK